MKPAFLCDAETLLELGDSETLLTGLPYLARYRLPHSGYR